MNAEQTGCCGGSGACGSTDVQLDDVASAVKDHYGNVAKRVSENQKNECGIPSDLYSAEQIDKLNDTTLFASAGCGNPVGLSDVGIGETLLDLGSGGGVDCFLAALQVGKNGNVIGIDATPEMVKLATENAAKMGVKNVTFKLGKIETIPQQDDSVDLVISNCVISLVERKDLVLQEIARVLKPGGRFIISDMMSLEPLPDSVRNSVREWVSCVGGADTREQFLERIKDAGFVNIQKLEDRLVSDKELGNANTKYEIRSVTIKAFKP